VKDIEQLKTNVKIVKQTQPMNYVEQEELEQLMG
jgi:hypothetical protein